MRTGSDVEFNTFTLLARCPRSGALGVAMATGEMAVGSRCPYAKAGVGAVATQAMTDPRLGPLALRLLDTGYSAPKVLAELASSDPAIERRQIGIVDADGRAVARTGAGARDWKGHRLGPGCVAMGNRLVGEGVIAAMERAFAARPGDDLAERLLAAIEAGRDAGGQPDGQRSAAILVVETRSFPLVDLRVDEHAEPVAELRRLYRLYAPLIPYYRERAANPELGTYDEWLKARGLA
ncbi:MAG: DUF1028 domain-containing protein [Proteobacteria bacterium]|nr:DUF1028 domain-containing protein [Pseudomonadota bacterium]